MARAQQAFLKISEITSVVDAGAGLCVVTMRDGNAYKVAETSGRLFEYSLEPAALREPADAWRDWLEVHLVKSRAFRFRERFATLLQRG